MPKPNFYMSDKDRSTLLSVITNYISMWGDADEGMDDEEYKELCRARNKIKNMNKTKSYKNAVIDNALEIANKVWSVKRKRGITEDPTCSACEHWKETNNEYIGYCPIIEEHTEGDESCNDFEDIK